MRCILMLVLTLVAKPGPAMAGTRFGLPLSPAPGFFRKRTSGGTPTRPRLMARFRADLPSVRQRHLPTIHRVRGVFGGKTVNDDPVSRF
jgi:hypothetical protein